MDQMIQDHSKEKLEEVFEAIFIAEQELFSLMVQETEIPWLQFIPKKTMDLAENVANLYAEIHKIAFYLQTKGYGHFNVAKLGNKLPFYHIHLVFRSTEDEAWPSPIWCHEPLNASLVTAKKLKADLSTYFSI